MSSSTRSLPTWIEALASDPLTRACPAVVEASHLKRELSYGDLHLLSLKIAHAIKSLLPVELIGGVRPVCLHMHRSADWYAAYIACARIGVPVVCASRDLPDKEIEDRRLDEIFSVLDPVLVVSDSKHSRGAACPVVYLDQLLDIPSTNDSFSCSNKAVDKNFDIIAYHFTGGTTGTASKCVKITHAMVAHEIRCYPSIFTAASRDVSRVLQNSSLFWPASAFGQLNIALAFKACVVLTVEGGASAEETSNFVKTFRIDCIGVVPSVLRSLNPQLIVGSLRTVFTWGESLPKQLACEWCSSTKDVVLVDLLIATEYWLSFYAVVTPNWNHSYSLVRGAEIRLLPAGEAGGRETLFVAGPMVTSGYTDVSLNESRFKNFDKKRFFCTNDSASFDRSSQETRIIFHGRTDDLQKIGGKFVDLSLARNRILDSLDKKVVKDCVFLRKNESEIALCVALSGPANMSSIIQTALETVPGIAPANVHAVADLPRNAATGKIDVRKMHEKFCSPVFSSEYALPDAEIAESKLLGKPNPQRWIWLLIPCVIFSINWSLLFSLLLNVAIQVVSSMCVPVTQIVYLPFVIHALQIPKSTPKTKWRLTKRYLEKVKKICFEFPGDTPFVGLALVTLGSVFPISIVTEFLAISGVVRVARRDAFVEYCFFSACGINLCMYLSNFPFAQTFFILIFFGFPGIRSLLNHIILSYVNLPWDLAWAWESWWRDIPSYYSVGIYYWKKLNLLCGKKRWFFLLRDPVLTVLTFLSTCFNMQDRSGYALVHKSSSRAWGGSSYSSERSYPCDHCGKCVPTSHGAYDKFGKFPTIGEEKNLSAAWCCETCWWGNVIVDPKKGYQTPRIGLWSSDWVCGKMDTNPFTENNNVIYSDDDLVSTRDPSECGDSDISPDEGASSCVIRKACLESLAFIGWDEACVCKSGLTALSSLSKVEVYEQLKKRLPDQLADASSSAASVFKNVFSLSDLCNSIHSHEKNNIVKEPPSRVSSDGAGTYRVLNASAGLWAAGACDWLLSVKLPVQRGVEKKEIEAKFVHAIKALKKKHPALRAKPLDEISSAAWMQQAVSLSPERFRSIVVRAALDEWPRIQVDPFLESDPVPLSFVYLDKLTTGKVKKMANEHRGSVFIPPFECVVFLPSSSPVAAGSVYVYFRVTHLFADGYCLNTISADLDTFLQQETPLSSVETMNAFTVLEKRLFSAASPRSLRSDYAVPNLCNATEELFRDYTLVQVMWLQHSTVLSLSLCATRLGLPVDILVMGLVTSSLAEKLEWKRMPISLMHSLRDGPNETQMLGFFSDYRDLGFFDTDSNYLELFHQLAVKIRNRDWRKHSQQNYDHSYGRHAWDESLFPVSFNLLPHPRRKGNVQPIETYWRSKPRYGQKDCRLIHAYIEETKPDKEWAIRMHFNRRLFDCTWIVDFVCRCMDRSIKQILSDPTLPVLTSSSRSAS